jgi:diguanylate cyclase (GGDEF)-like protein
MSKKMQVLGLLRPEEYPESQRKLVEDFNSKLLALDGEKTRLTMTVSKQEQERQVKITNVVRIYNINITRNLIEDEIYDYRNNKGHALLKQMNLPIPCPLKDFVRKSSEQIIGKKALEDYRNYFNQNRILEEFDKGNINQSFEYEVVYEEDNSLHAIQHTMILQREQSTNDIIAMCSARDITAVTQSKRQLVAAQESVERGLFVIEGLMKDFYSIWLINKNTMEMTLFKAGNDPEMKKRVSRLVEIGNYNQGIIEYADNYIVPQDRERVLREVVPGAIIENLKNNDTYTINFSRIDEFGKSSYHQMIFTDTHSEFFVMAFRDVDKLVRSQIENISREMLLKEYESDFLSMELIHRALGSGSCGMLFNVDNEITSSYFSNTFRHMLGYEGKEDFPEAFESWTDLLYGEDKDRVLNAYWDAVKDYSGKTNFNVEYRIYTKDRGLRWFQMLGSFSRREDGSPLKFVGLLMDIQEKKNSEFALLEQLKIVEALSNDYLNVYKVNAKTRSVSIIKLDGYVTAGISKDNKAQVYPYDAVYRQYIKDRVFDADKESMLHEISLDVIKEKLADSKEYVSSYRAVVEGQVQYYQFKYVRLDNEPGNDPVILAGFKNIDAIVKAERERESLIHLSETDQMTGLFNRVSGQNKTVSELASLKGGLFIIMDINHFKIFNDTYGHLAGDQVIIAFANIIREVFREQDIKFRLGGDEFAIFIPGNSKRDVAVNLTTRFSESLDNLNIEEVKGTKVSASIGVGIIPPDCKIDFQKLYSEVDAAVYQSKRDSTSTKVTYINY